MQITELLSSSAVQSIDLIWPQRVRVATIGLLTTVYAVVTHTVDIAVAATTVILAVGSVGLSLFECGRTIVALI